MASIATGMKGLSREALVALATAISPDRVLPALLIGLAPGSDGQPRWCQSYLVRIRHQGFMVICPDEDQLHEALVELFGEAEDEGVLFFTGQIDLTSMRGKALGQVAATLLDLPWAAAQSFIRNSSLRGAAAREATISRFVFEEQAGRPLTSSVLDLAQSWITTHMEEEAAQEYATAAEDDELVPVTPMVAPVDQDYDPSSAAGEEAAKLRARIQELEEEVAKSRQYQPPVSKAPAVAKFGKTPGLFQPQRTPADLDPADLLKLQQMAGAPPPRTGQHEKRRVTPLPAATQEQDALFAEVEKEVLEAGLADANLPDPGRADPLTRLLVVQMQQNAILLQKIAGKHTDPVLGALSGSDSGSGSSSSGVKGCVAREAFLKAVTDMESVATTVRKNALVELGMEASREDSSVMRRYIERRIPLSEHRLLCHVATLAAEGWAQAFESGNNQMLGFLGLLLMFVEQVALDQGRLQLGWLLTGLPEPNHHVHFSFKKKPGLKPFSSLASPVWVSANLAYLKDLDFFANRLNPSIPTKTLAIGDKDELEGADPKPKPKRRARKGGRGKGGDESESAAA